MKIRLIDGQFADKDAIEIITRLIQVKIKFHEGKIRNAASEEEVRLSEKRIHILQKNLYDIRYRIDNNPLGVKLESLITVTN